MTNPPLFAVGDVQGCLQSLDELLELLPGNAELLFLGDLVNRGPESLGVLRRIRSLGFRARFLLGNHDLHLLAIAAGFASPHKKDTLDDVLGAPDRDELIDWLRRGRLLIEDRGVVFVHAGLNPAWSLEDARALAREMETGLCGNDWREMFRDMYGNTQWSTGLTGAQRRRAVFNSFSRIRFVDRYTGELDFDQKEGLEGVPERLVPWFEFTDRRSENVPICFGHWSMLGLKNETTLMSIDTGCLWGGALTALNIETRKVVQVSCPMWADPLRYSSKKR